MSNYARVAMTVAANKEKYPERYCSVGRCLWKTAKLGPDGKYVLNANPCRKHPTLNTAPSLKDDADYIAGSVSAYLQDRE